MGNQFEFTLIDENENNANETFEIAIQEIKRIETLFSQLCDQFLIRRNYANPFESFSNKNFSGNKSINIGSIYQ
jgi:hypothetical protein